MAGRSVVLTATPDAEQRLAKLRSYAERGNEAGTYSRVDSPILPYRPPGEKWRAEKWRAEKRFRTLARGQS